MLKYHTLFTKANRLYETYVKRRKMLAYREFLENSQWWPYEKLQAFQWEELAKLLKHAYENVPYWRGQFDRLGLKPSDIKTYEDFCRIPVTDKKSIRENYEEMRAVNYNGKTWKKSTGGSTGEPLHFEYTPESYDWRVAASKRGYSWAGCEDGVKQAYIWGIAIGKVSPFKKLKECLHHLLLRQKYFNCFEFSEKEMAHAIVSLNRYKPEIIVGYTNPLYSFAKYIKNHGKISFKPKAVISAAEALHDFQRKEISSVFGCGVFNTYGSREFMLIASECEKHKGLHINMENLLIEVLGDDGKPVKSGETGEVVITDLHNYGMPFIRYKIGDLAVFSGEPCLCGRGLPMLRDVVGRSLDMIKVSNGNNIPGEFFPHLMKDFHEVKQFQVIQDKINSLVVKIVKAENFDESRLALMKDEIFKVVGREVNVSIVFVDEIPLTATGKRRVTISELEGASD
jgi:phenylacetate-CoA ligase